LIELLLLLPATITTEGCTKLANGYNFRDVQDVAARPVLLYTAEEICPLPTSMRGVGALAAFNTAGVDGGPMSVQLYNLMRQLNMTAPTKEACGKQPVPDVSG
jgi:hypothetical protein